MCLLAQVIKNHTDKLRAAGHADLIPDDGLAMLRFHSCYPWHNKVTHTLPAATTEQVQRPVLSQKHGGS